MTRTMFQIITPLRTGGGSPPLHHMSSGFPAALGISGRLPPRDLWGSCSTQPERSSVTSLPSPFECGMQIPNLQNSWARWLEHGFQRGLFGKVPRWRARNHHGTSRVVQQWVTRRQVHVPGCIMGEDEQDYIGMLEVSATDGSGPFARATSTRAPGWKQLAKLNCSARSARTLLRKTAQIPLRFELCDLVFRHRSPAQDRRAQHALEPRLAHHRS